ncbi:MAG: dTDP-4-dehydrorhamnose 3,5-epimerase family protein [Bdellovibrio sp.]
MDTKVDRIGTAIEGLYTVPLRKIEGPKGAVLHILRANAPHFEKFGEVYVSITNPGEVKGWKFHKEISQNFAVPVGIMKFVFFDDREGSPTKGQAVVLEASRENYHLIHVPPEIWYAFSAVSEEPGYIVNCASHWHTEGESIAIPLADAIIPKAVRDLIESH